MSSAPESNTSTTNSPATEAPSNATPSTEAAPTSSQSTNTNDSVTKTSNESSSAVDKSNYYFFKSTPAHLASMYKPQLISAGSDAPTSTTTSSSGPSAWNSSGTTWEEKGVSDWAKERLETLFVGIEPADGVAPGTVSITRATSVNGEASLVYTRGKKRCSFEFQVTLEWEGSLDDNKASGKVSLPDLDFTNMDDFEIEITANTNDPTHIKLRDALRKHTTQQFRDRMKMFVDELCQRE